MPVSGDFAALRSLRNRLSEASVRAILPVAAQRMGAAGVKLLADEFVQGRDPYGNKWAPTVKGNKPLRRSGRMAASVTSQPNGATVKITIGTNYAIYHQEGVDAHRRKGGTIRQTARGRFAKKGAKNVYLSRFKAFKHGGIPRRQMLPAAWSGGLGPTWSASFRTEERAVVKKALLGR